MNGWNLERICVFGSVYRMSAGDRQAGDNVERKLDFTGGQQDENANVIMCECMRGENKCVFSFCLPAAQSPFSLPRPFFFPSCFPSFIPLSVTWRVPIHPSPCSSISPISSHRPSSNCCRLSRDACLSRLILSPAEEEDHHHLRGGEEVSAQVHHRSEGQHPAGDPGDYGGVGGDAPSWLQLGDHHPQGGARQAGTGAHAGVRQGEEEEEEGERMMERVTVRPNVLFLLGSERGRFQRGCEF